MFYTAVVAGLTQRPHLLRALRTVHQGRRGGLYRHGLCGRNGQAVGSALYRVLADVQVCVCFMCVCARMFV
jgi:hypothetical protein